MKANKIAASAEEMKQKLFGRQQSDSEMKPLQADPFANYREHIGKTVTIPIKHITVEDNVRKNFNKSSTKYQELVGSIRRDGLLQNLVVELRKNQLGLTYISLVSGQRRFFAAEEAGLERVTCLLKEYSRADRVSTGLTENLFRQDLTCIDVAEGYAELRKEGCTEEEIAARFKRDERTIHRYLLIASWPDDIKQTMRMHSEVFTTRAIFNQFVSKKFENEDEMRAAVNARLTMALQPGDGKPKLSVTQRSEVKIAASTLSEKLKLPVAIKGNDKEGKITIKYHNREELENIIKIIQGSNSS
jgi:ParB family transcriptional regulator, chromosome partitioning protein